MLAGEPVTIAGFIDHEEPRPLDELLVELVNGNERMVHRDELTTVFDVIQGHWRTREVYRAVDYAQVGNGFHVLSMEPCFPPSILHSGNRKIVSFRVAWWIT